MANWYVCTAELLICATPAVATAGSDADKAQGSAVFVDWTVYKSKSAMTLKAIKPTWEGLSNGGWAVSRWDVCNWISSTWPSQ